jgi:LuxR family maltose regulon positive regulatory protein
MGDPIRALLQSGTNRSLSLRARAVARRILDAFDGSLDRLHHEESPELPQPLTDRETEVLTYLADAMSNKAMARKMFVSLDTVKTHLKNLYAKLGVSNRQEAVVRGRELGLI